MKFLKKLGKRINLPDTAVGKVLKAVGGLIGVGGTAAVTVVPGLLFELTGNTIVDVAIVVVSGAVIYLAGKYPVPDQYKKQVED